MLAPMMDTIADNYNKPNTWGDTLKIGIAMTTCMTVSARSLFVAKNPAPIVPDFTTRHLLLNVPEEMSSKILKKLQAENISIRSLVTAAALSAIHELIRTSKDDVLKIWTTHEVDTRVFDKNYDQLKGTIKKHSRSVKRIRRNYLIDNC